MTDLHDHLAQLTRQHAEAWRETAKLERQVLQLRMDLAQRDATIALYLAAEQQHAHEPCAFTDLDPPEPSSTGHVMPARALLHRKQAVGLLW